MILMLNSTVFSLLIQYVLSHLPLQSLESMHSKYLMKYVFMIIFQFSQNYIFYTTLLMMIGGKSNHRFSSYVKIFFFILLKKMKIIVFINNKVSLSWKDSNNWRLKIVFKQIEKNFHLHQEETCKIVNKIKNFKDRRMKIMVVRYRCNRKSKMNNKSQKKENNVKNIS